MVNVDELRGMPDVEYDFGVSASVKAAFNAEASRLTGQRGSRSSWRDSGMQEFEGHFSQLFQDNGRTQLSDLSEVATALKQVATELEDVEQAAREENNRRRIAREWAEQQANKSGFEKFADGIWDVDGDNSPPSEASQITDTGPSKSAPAVPVKSRQTPSGGGGGGGGTSSARPSNLRDFASNSRGGDDAFSGSVGKLNGAVSDFASSCSWASLDASGPIQGLQEWLKLNEEDAKWADTVAQAFEAAGSEGQVTVSNASLDAALQAAGVSASRRDIQVDPPTAYGSPPTTGYANDPVNTASGNFIENECDLAFNGPAELISLRRTYNSLSEGSGAFGPGWSSWTEAGLSFAQESARLRLPDGRVIVFPRLGSGWDRAAGENLWLTVVGDGFEVAGSTGLRWAFSGDGRLRSTGTTDGPSVQFRYDQNGLLTGLQHEFGRWVQWERDPVSGLVTSAWTDDGRSATYTYDGAGQLQSVRTGAGIRSYRWNDRGLIEAVIAADGVVEAENTYDEQRRVLTQLSPFGRLTRFVYLPGGVTEVSDADGERANTWIADGRGRLIGVIDAAGNRQSTSYDRWGNPVMITERNGAVSVSAYDERGRRTAQQTPTGAKITWEYDELDRPTTITVGSAETGDDIEPAVTHYRYEGNGRNPSEMVDAEGGVTAMVWERGLLQQVTDPTGVRVSFDYDERGDLVASTNAVGDTARLERDGLGRVVAATTPMGNRTEYIYDGEGPLLSRRDPDGAIWRYEHSAGGQLTAVIDPTGGRTEVEYGAHGEQAKTIDPLGRAVSSAYDDLGNRVRTELPDGSAWEYDWDAMSRLRSITDAGGGQWKLDYDVEGMITGTVDPTGVQRSVGRDQAGRPLSLSDAQTTTSATYDVLGRTLTETGPDGSSVINTYDRCGRLIEHTDARGGVTRFARDAAGRAVDITHPMGTTFHYEYDSCGRHSATIDTDGTRYEFVYDADSRVIRELWPTGEEAWLRYDANARPIERFEPGAGLTTFRYDAAGRLIGTRDAWHGRRRFRYDNAGQLVEAVNGVGGVTRFDYDVLGRCIAIEDPSGGRTERTFDPMGRLLSETDPLGRTTRYAYDLAGRPTKRTDPTGSELSWRYDECGRLTDTVAGQALLSRVERDFASRTVRVFEPGRAGRPDTVNTLVWNAGGDLVRRLRSRTDAPGEGIGLAWSYDLDGRRTSFTGVHGDQTQYEYDLAGRVAAVETPELGRAVIDRDAIGRIVSMSAPGLYASWTWSGGGVVRLEVAREGRTEVTEIERDEASRVVAEIVDGLRTSYGYDEAGQLVQARRGDGSVTTWEYDSGGRLVRETVDGAARSFSYDAAGQLLSERSPAGETTYAYDAAGQRISEIGPAGERRFSWDPRGFLSSITEVTHANDKVTARTQLVVDALGELADVDGDPVAWDSAAGLPTLAAVGEVSVAGFGPLHGVWSRTGEGRDADGLDRAEWIAPDWRPRPVGEDPWGVTEGAIAGGGLPSGVQIAGSGSLVVDGLEWMQARVYDPSTRGFLSTDPLDPVTGAGWAGNPYSFAGNDPLNQSDPWGLRPITDDELKAYQDAGRGGLQNAWEATKDWVGDNWEYIAAGAMVVGGVALMATGIGGPAGLALMAGSGALISAGASTAMQKFQNGSVDWGQVAKDGAIGAVAGAAGGGAGMAAARMGTSAGARFGAGVAGGAADGAVSGGLTYATSGQPFTAEGLARSTAMGAVTGGATGGAMSQVGARACFVAGTQVLLADGSSKPIEEIVVGDEVVAADPETGLTHARPVVETFVHDDVETWEVVTSSGVVTSTAEHPFYVRGKGWVPVQELVHGDVLVEADGAETKLETATPTGIRATVHNFHVAELHNYHIGVGDCWVRVHNECWSPTHNEVRRSGLTDSHHIIQHAAVRDVPGYSRGQAPATHLTGPSTTPGTPHYNATQVQRQATNRGTYGAEREVAAESLRAAGKSEDEITGLLQQSDRYFMDELGLSHSSATRIPGR